MNRTRTLGWLAVLSLILVAGPLEPAEAGIKKWKDKLKNKVDRKIEQKVDQAMDTAVECVFDDPECIRQAKADGKEVTVVGADGKPVPDDQRHAVIDDANAAPGEGVWTKYDFVPGERVIYYNDFAKDEVGDFPRRLEFASGSMEVAEWRDRHFLRAGDKSAYFTLVLPEKLPERFTIEFDFSGTRHKDAVSIGLSGKSSRAVFSAGQSGVFLGNGEVSTDGRAKGDYTGKINRARLMVDGRYAKAYLNNERLANIPNLDFDRSDRFYVHLAPYSGVPVYIKNISVNAGGKDMYDAIRQEGRYVTQGIFFDTDSDRLRPESTPTLKKIGKMLQEHKDLALTIEGYTDNRGDDDYNKDLSMRRADAVRRYLMETYEILEKRLKAAGFGEGSPAASNDTPEGRQQNRRVELVRRETES